VGRRLGGSIHKMKAESQPAVSTKGTRKRGDIKKMRFTRERTKQIKAVEDSKNMSAVGPVGMEKVKQPGLE